jgi:hypothetical protein
MFEGIINQASSLIFILKVLDEKIKREFNLKCTYEYDMIFQSNL